MWYSPQGEGKSPLIPKIGKYLVKCTLNGIFLFSKSIVGEIAKTMQKQAMNAQPDSKYDFFSRRKPWSQEFFEVKKNNKKGEKEDSVWTVSSCPSITFSQVIVRSSILSINLITWIFLYKLYQVLVSTTCFNISTNMWLSISWNRSFFLWKLFLKVFPNVSLLIPLINNCLPIRFVIGNLIFLLIFLWTLYILEHIAHDISLQGEIIGMHVKVHFK